MTPDITVIVPVYNRQEFLGGCLDSILSQDLPTKICIVDDCSTDATLEVAQKYAETHPNIKVSSNEYNSGSPDLAINREFSNCDTPFVIWLGSDDYYNAPNALSTLQEALLKSTSANYAYCDFDVKGDLTLAPTHFGAFSDCDHIRCLSHFAQKLIPAIPWNGMWRTSHFQKFASPWPVFEWAKSSSDTLNGVRQFARHLQTIHVPEKLISYVFHPEQNTAGLKARVDSLEHKLGYFLSVVDNADLAQMLNVDNDRFVLREAAEKLTQFHIRKHRTFVQFSDLSTKDVHLCNQTLDKIDTRSVLGDL